MALRVETTRTFATDASGEPVADRSSPAPHPEPREGQSSPSAAIPPRGSPRTSGDSGSRRIGEEIAAEVAVWEEWARRYPVESAPRYENATAEEAAWLAACGVEPDS